jgi:hypothetical protein
LPLAWNHVADQFLKESLLEDLGISDTCTLWGDPHHLNGAADPVFKETFGPIFPPQITGNLSQMLQSPHKDQWERNYLHARTILRTDPEKIAALDKIYSNPSYYAGYYIAALPRNFGVISSTPAEQNHSSIWAAFRGTTSMEMEQQVKIHFERQA